jgi:hypothetical protein
VQLTDIEKFKTRGQYEKQLSTEKKSELVARAKKIVNAEQLSELSGVIDMIADNSELVPVVCTKIPRR